MSVESLGAVTGDRPIPVGLIALIAYTEDAGWDPQPRTPAEGMTMLVEHAYGMDDPPAAMRIAHRAAAHALVVEGDRGEADEAAAGLLQTGVSGAGRRFYLNRLPRAAPCAHGARRAPRHPHQAPDVRDEQAQAPATRPW